MLLIAIAFGVLVAEVSGIAADTNASCGVWANAGECDKVSYGHRVVSHDEILKTPRVCQCMIIFCLESRLHVSKLCYFL